MEKQEIWKAERRTDAGGDQARCARGQAVVTSFSEDENRRDDGPHATQKIIIPPDKWKEGMDRDHIGDETRDRHGRGVDEIPWRER